MPGVALEIRLDDLSDNSFAKSAQRFDIEMEMHRAIGAHIAHAEPKKADGGMEAAPIFWMIRAEKLLLEMHEGTSNLNQALEEKMIFIPALQPKMLQYVVRFIVLTCVEAGKIALIARVESQRGVSTKLFDKGGNAVVFFHRAKKGRKLFSAALCLTS